MKFYGSAPDASMSMHADPDLICDLEALILGKLHGHSDEVLGPVTVAVETGTHLGMGSTRFIAETFARTAPPTVFHTIEAAEGSFQQAKANLAQFPFVRCHLGCSVVAKEAETWMAEDDALLHPDQYPDVWTDHMTDAVKHYAIEVANQSHNPEWEGEDLLARLLLECRDAQPLVILDSAGGIGWLEFQIMLCMMENRRYYVLLDDVHHIKHFRSFIYMSSMGNGFDILKAKGKWALAVHNVQELS